MAEYTLHELKDLARSLDFELDMMEQTGKHQHLVSGDRLLTKDEFLLHKLRTLIQQIEDTKLEIKFKSE